MVRIAVAEDEREFRDTCAVSAIHGQAVPIRC